VEHTLSPGNGGSNGSEPGAGGVWWAGTPSREPNIRESELKGGRREKRNKRNKMKRLKMKMGFLAMTVHCPDLPTAHCPLPTVQLTEATVFLGINATGPHTRSWHRAPDQIGSHARGRHGQPTAGCNPSSVGAMGTAGGREAEHK
jgi:hypothetical protein